MSTTQRITLVADREHLLLALDLGDGNDRRLVQDDAAAFDIDEGVRRTQVDRHIRGEHSEKTSEHV
jgi:hypothetical protein